VNKAGTGSGIVISNPLGINCGGDCSENYDDGEVVVINPNPDATSVFSGWSGDPDCVDGVVTMNANKTCTANFSKRFSLTVNKAGTGSGIVTSNLQGINCGGDCSENYDPGVVVTLIANPDAVSVFSGWTGDPDCADETVTMNANKTCIANFNASLISLAIGATTLATGEAGVSFTSDLMISGGVAPYGVSIDRGKLPAGLSLENNGIISGTLSPTARSEKITVRITDSVKQSISKTFTIIVLKTLRIVDKPKVGRVGNNYTDSLKTKGGRGPFSWSIASGALPSGLNFNTTTGAITGIPTQAGEFLLTVQVTDALGGIDVETLALKIK
jgi:hypothetical protein